MMVEAELERLVHLLDRYNFWCRVARSMVGYGSGRAGRAYVEGVGIHIPFALYVTRDKSSDYFKVQEELIPLLTEMGRKQGTIARTARATNWSGGFQFLTFIIAKEKDIGGYSSMDSYSIRMSRVSHQGDPMSVDARLVHIETGVKVTQEVINTSHEQDMSIPDACTLALCLSEMTLN